MPHHSDLVEIPGTEIELSRYSLGTAPLSGLFQKVSEQESDLVVQCALNSGMNYFDTAPLYGSGVGETRLGRILSQTSMPFVISTKVGRVLTPGRNPEAAKWPDSDPEIRAEFDYTPDGIKRSLEESLIRLNLDHVDIVYIHEPDDLVTEAVEVVFPVLDDLRRQRIIKAIGIGINNCAPGVAIMNAVDLDVVLIAGRFTLLDQSAQQELLPIALKTGVAIVAAGVYNSGILANPIPGAHFDYEPASAEILHRAEKIRNFLKVNGLPLTAAALQFPLRHPAVVSVLNGSANLAEIESNIANFDLPLPSDLWEKMEGAGLIEPILSL